MFKQSKRTDTLNKEKAVQTSIKNNVLNIIESDKGREISYKEEPEIAMSGDDYKLKNLLKLGVQLKPSFLANANSRMEITNRIEQMSKKVLDSLTKENKENHED